MSCWPIPGLTSCWPSDLVCLAFQQVHAESATLSAAAHTAICDLLLTSSHPGVAQDVYRNATIEKLALLRALREEDERRQAFDEQLASTLNELKVDLSVRS